MPNTKKNDWAQRFGAKRRATDRAILQECERLIEAEEILARQIAARKMGLVKDVNGERLPDDLWKQASGEARERIARAFGRPLDSVKH